MFKNYLKITIRSLMKSKVFVLINVLGMGIALACCVVAYLVYDHNRSYDKQHENVSSVYRVNFISELRESSLKYGITPSPMVMSLKEDLTNVDHFIRYNHELANIRVENELFLTEIAYTDPAFLEVFTYPIISGSAKGLDNKGNILISDKLATIYFGDEDPLGKQITQPYNGGTKEYIVSGVFEKMGKNTTFQFDVLTYYDNYYDTNPDADETSWKDYSTVLLNIKNESRVPIITEQLQSYIEAQNIARYDFQINRFYLDPFVGMAERSVREGINHRLYRTLPPTMVVGPVVVAVLLLLLACFNFTNTSIAISSRRLKEIGIRKVMGGMRKHLILQFLGESVLLCLLALVVGLVMAEFLVPAYSALWDFLALDLNYTENYEFFLFLLGLLIVTGLIAGSYPALYITKFEPIAILNRTFKIGKTNLFSRFLLIFQFMLTLLAVIMGVAFMQNAKFQESIDVGFDKKEVIYAKLQDEGEYHVYRNSLKSDARIRGMAGSKDQIFSSWHKNQIKHEDLELQVDIFEIGDEYISTMGMTLAKGRDFRKGSETDRKESVIVNEEFVKAYGWEDPIGKRVIWMDTVQLNVIGVTKDFFFRGFWSPMKPAMFRYASVDKYTHLIVSAEQKDVLAINEFMEAKWKKLFPNKIYNGRFMDDIMTKSFDANEKIASVFIFLGIIATLLSISCLYTLASLNIIKYAKEICIRRIMGASVKNVIRIVNQEFIIIFFIAAILGSVASYYLADLLMGRIWDYYMKASTSTFLFPVLFVFLVSAIVIISKGYKAAIVNPGLTLRDE